MLAVCRLCKPFLTSFTCDSWTSWRPSMLASDSEASLCSPPLIFDHRSCAVHSLGLFLHSVAAAECESRDFIVEQGGLEALLRHLQPPLSPPEESRPPESQHPQQGAHFPETSSPKGDSVAPSRESASSTQVDSVSSVRESEGGHTREAPSVACGDRSKPWRDLELETEAARALYVLAVSPRMAHWCGSL